MDKIDQLHIDSILFIQFICDKMVKDIAPNVYDFVIFK